MATSATGRPGPIAKLAVVGLLLGSIGLATGVGAAAPPDERPGPPSAEAVANAQPRDLVIDERGLGYLRGASGELTPYGHSVAAVNRPIEPRAPGGVPGPPGGGGGTDDGTVTFGQWGFGGQVLKSSGRILFQMADGWYVCSGTAVTDSATDRSIVLTAAHCIYDDVAKAFALQAIFIPNQDDGESDKTDWNCSNDPYGCWILDHGVVDLNWTNRTFPDNIAWDYGFYVVSDTNAWSITSDYQASGDLALDGTVGTLALDLAAPDIGVTAHALGYSYDVDPELMYCKEPLATESTYGDFWLGKCDMSGGSSGGPWVQPMDEATGMGPVFSVNSWGYTSRSGMGGPVLHGSSAGLLFDFAQQSAFGVTAGGYVVNPDSTTINASPTATITAPADGSSVASGTSIAFAGSANDTEDGDLDVDLVWTSSLAGQIGTGSSFSAVLWEGTHTVTASVTDSGGLTGSASVTVTVNPADTGGGGDTEPRSLTASSVNNGSSWTATVTLTGSAGQATTGTWNDGVAASGCTIATGASSCSFSRSGIPKKVSSVIYTDSSDSALTVTVFKP
jgi:hypothetical protein